MKAISAYFVKLDRYAGVIASFAYSLANFGVLFALQGTVTPFEFGVFAIAQVLLQFGISLSNAVFCSPIVVAVSASKGREAAVISSFARANLVFSVVCTLLVFVLLVNIGGDFQFAVVSSALCFLSWLRWFFRSVELSLQRFRSPAVADFLYSLVVLLGGLTLWLLGTTSITNAGVVQLAGCVVAFITVAGPSWRSILGSVGADGKPFFESMNKHGRWALLGVLTTEATANAHAYLIGFLSGPAVYAPVAAVSLFYRPITILAQALTQYERPRMAISIADANFVKLSSEVRAFQFMSIATWFSNVVLIVGVLVFAPHLIGTDAYDPFAITLSAMLLGASFLARSLRGAESAALQAAGSFRPLAWVTVVTAPLTVGGALAMILLFPTNAPLTLVAIVVGETITAILIRRLYAKFQRSSREQGAFS